MSHIFVSYSRKDSECAYKLQRQLEAQGFKVWIDKNDISAGAPFPLEILQAIRSAAAVLILWSENASQSHYVNKEIEEAITQKMSRSVPVIPVWLDNYPLHQELTSLNAVHLSPCSNDKIDTLVNKLSGVRYRSFKNFDANLTLDQLGAVPLTSSLPLVTLPLVESVYCKGRIIAPASARLSDVKSHKAKSVQVFLEFLGSSNNEDAIEKIYNFLQTKQPDTPFFLFHFSGRDVNGSYALTDDEENSPHGDWLDPVNTIYDTLEKTIGRGGATLQLFNALPATLNFAIGMQFFKFWHVKFYHFASRDKVYRFVLDTDDL